MEVEPDSTTYSIVLGACASSGDLEQGRQVHERLLQNTRDMITSDSIVQNSLLNLYAKCGRLDESTKNALEIFKTIQIKDTISWTSMILGYAQHCQVPQSLELFREMIHQGLSPDYVTYTSILHACGHEGLFHETLEILRWMERDYGIQRTLEHYHCVIDMLARLGQLDEAEELLKAISYEHESDTIAWISLLSGLKTQLDDNFRQQMIRSS
ncbi:hypothetical protein SELMODRAFT_128569 [Selaginella moellendorffii]|uniref:Pentacotripeptide-repeat region of PRORP domain-containing protein n=1 Tax=Selaginella moellendorffii TaxID=88036 RepID=D8SZD4_SELML|nr:hypothetical protein SELMODRAFT_128569 [Selaginella moellendorffii]